MLDETNRSSPLGEAGFPTIRVAGFAPYRRSLHQGGVALIEDYSISRRQPPASGYSPERQIAIAYRGGFTWRVSREEIDVVCGDSLLVRSGECFAESHLYESVGHASILITPSQALLDEFDGLRRPLREAFARSRRPANVITTLTTHALLNRLGGTSRSFSLFAEEAVAWMLEGILCEDSRFAPSAGARHLAEAKALLHEAASENLSLLDIAREVGTLPAALAVSFRRLEHRTLESYRRHVKRTGTKPHRSPPRIDYERLAAVIHHVDQSYADRCSLGDLAELADTGRYQFIRGFSAVMGLTPAQYVIAARLRAAATDLATSADAITEIAFRVGFNDISHFNSCFRDAFGMSPRCWRSRAVGFERPYAA